MKLLVNCTITREIPVEVDDKFKVLVDDPDDEDAIDELYIQLALKTELAKRYDEYIHNINKVTDAESKKMLFEF